MRAAPRKVKGCRRVEGAGGANLPHQGDQLPGLTARRGKCVAGNDVWPTAPTGRPGVSTWGRGHATPATPATPATRGGRRVTGEQARMDQGVCCGGGCLYLRLTACWWWVVVVPRSGAPSDMQILPARRPGRRRYTPSFIVPVVGTRRPAGPAGHPARAGLDQTRLDGPARGWFGDAGEGGLTVEAGASTNE